MPNTIWEPRPKLETKMPWKIVKGSDSENPFCVVKESDGKTVKCHPTREKAKSHLAALYVNEPSAAKKGLGFGLLKSLITERVEELKACGANKPGGGGFSAGNTCARGGKGSGVGSVENPGIVDKMLVKNGFKRQGSVLGKDGTRRTTYHGPGPKNKRTVAFVETSPQGGQTFRYQQK